MFGHFQTFRTFSVQISDVVPCFRAFSFITGEAGIYPSPWETVFSRIRRFSAPRGSPVHGTNATVRTHPNAFDRIRTHPGRSEQDQTRPRTSKNFRKLPKTSKKSQKVLKNFRDRRVRAVVCFVCLRSSRGSREGIENERKSIKNEMKLIIDSNWKEINRNERTSIKTERKSIKN